VELGVTVVTYKAFLAVVPTMACVGCGLWLAASQFRSRVEDLTKEARQLRAKTRTHLITCVARIAWLLFASHVHLLFLALLALVALCSLCVLLLCVQVKETPHTKCKDRLVHLWQMSVSPILGESRCVARLSAFIVADPVLVAWNLQTASALCWVRC
jgi:hypothetical protein